MIADVDGDGMPDIISVAVSSPVIGNALARQTLFAWSAYGNLMLGYPKILSPTLMWRLPRYTPILGDIDRNGSLDLAVGSYDSIMYFVDFQVPADSCNNPVTSFGYHRSFDWVGPSGSTDCSPRAPSAAATATPTATSIRWTSHI